MPVIHFKLPDGTVKSIEGAVGTPVMFLAKDNGIDQILAECGGCCSCATCHVHVDPDWFPRLPEVSDDELNMLEFAEGQDDTSRLSCQLIITEELDGLVVNVPESQY